jgi:hypothetical protein
LPPGVHTITDVGDFKDGGISVVGLNLVDTFIQVSTFLKLYLVLMLLQNNLVLLPFESIFSGVF